ncbi:PLD nuclease N-terminal domain-containing protein [Propionimicrobium sp. PCR01-08-3]|uniref:PLD nuclease N-terminal domain-containing protein n=1 Tax=Propionimicrobium sp. PCR01-08-3 TaxID=3052086 RepID=UPI00255C5430|nr:PLD nuclease N-terminal domain-containing protein [Propionimicrobium sp. PCR01-08-3]WIY83110.1 PLD nuclease N-terminal domain-containing protein [Propionimicrobium sp. PCR01-08-3]
MARIVPIIVLIALTIYCTIEVAQARAWEVRRAPKWLWAVVVICLPGVGPLAWLFFGRPLPPGRRPPPGEMRPPDEDEDFLRGL